MHRVRTVLNNLVPLAPLIHNAAGPERFASWLLKSGKTSCTVLVSITRHYNAPVQTEPFLNGSSSAYVEEMYNAWLADPKSVHVSWDSFFRNSSAGAAPGQAYQPPPSLAAPGRNQVPVTSIAPYLGGSAAPALGGQINEKIIDDHLAVQAIIRSYQARGHLVADLDPLGITYADLHGTYTDRKGAPPEQVVRHYMLGKAACGDVGHVTCK